MKNKYLGTGISGFHPLRKIAIILSGLRYAFRYDFSVAYKIVLSISLLVLCFVYRQWMDFGIILVSTGMMLIAETMNTAVEALCDFIEQRKNEKVKIIKDISSASAGISIFVWAIVLIIEVPRIIPLLAE